MIIKRGLGWMKRCVRYLLRQVETRLKKWTRPTSESLVIGTGLDLTRSKQVLIAENALLRQQLVILHRQVKRPALTQKDRCLLVILASRVRQWRNALLVVNPETLLGWHRQGFRLYWQRKSKQPQRESPVGSETIALIKTMALDNRLWGAKRIRGELLKLGITVSKRTVQKYMRQARRGQPPRRSSQTWGTFLANHASQMWACDFLQTYDLWFRAVFVFVIIELSSRRIVHVGVTRHPTDAWVAQQLREATPFGVTPRFLILDNDDKYGVRFEQVAASSQIKLLRTPPQAPKANAVCERCLGSIRRECLDHSLIFSEGHLQRLMKAYVDYFNRARPHQGLGQRIPEAAPADLTLVPDTRPIVALPVLGGLHHDYRRVA